MNLLLRRRLHLARFRRATPSAGSSGRRRGAVAAGMTLVELVVATGILLILTSAALPVARVTLQRNREARLREDLRAMRDAIDRYKDAADQNLIQVQNDTEGYPPDLDTLVKGVQLAG